MGGIRGVGGGYLKIVNDTGPNFFSVDFFGCRRKEKMSIEFLIPFWTNV